MFFSKTKGITLFLSVAFFAFVSCSKNAPYVSDDTETSIQVEVSDDKLSFSSLSEFSDILKVVDQQGMDKVNIVSAETKASVSFESLYDSEFEEFMSTLSPEEIEQMNAKDLYYEPEDEFIAYPALAKVLNDKREVIAGGYIYKFVSNGLLSIPVGTADSVIDGIETVQYSSLCSGETADLGNGISFSKIDYSECTTVVEENNCETKSNGNNYSFTLSNGVYVPADRVQRVKYEAGGGHANWFNKTLSGIFGVNVAAYNNYDNRHRMATRVFSQDYKICKSTGMVVRMQERFLGIWFNKNASEFRYGCLGPVCKYTYEGSISLASGTGLIKEAPKKLYTKPVVWIAVEIGDFIKLTSTNQDIGSMLYQGLKDNSSAINNFIDKNKEYKDSPKGIMAINKAEPNVAYYLYPQVEELVSHNSERDVIYWDLDWNYGAAIGFNMSTGCITSVTPFIPNVRDIEIYGIFAYSAVKYNGEWRMCVIYC